jgi:DNA replication protein DnaC
LAHKTCRRGFDVVFTDTHKQLHHLQAGWADGTYDKRPALHIRINLLVIDDFGLNSIQRPATLNQYDVINKRHERRSILLTSNRDPAEWATCLVDPLIAFAGLDRLSNQVHVLIITGASAEPRDIFGLVGGGLGGHPRPPPTTTFQPSCLWLH